ncbi:MAG: hypothetical protein NVS1B4_14200 [Gemmatimonadaceae bacterium]
MWRAAAVGLLHGADRIQPRGGPGLTGELEIAVERALCVGVALILRTPRCGGECGADEKHCVEFAHVESWLSADAEAPIRAGSFATANGAAPTLLTAPTTCAQCVRA